MAELATVLRQSFKNLSKQRMCEYHAWTRWTTVQRAVMGGLGPMERNLESFLERGQWQGRAGCPGTEHGATRGNSEDDLPANSLKNQQEKKQQLEMSEDCRKTTLITTQGY